VKPENTEEESFLTVAEVAELLKLNQQTVRNWIDAGSLPALKVGRRVRIRRSDLERKLEEGRTTPAPAPRSAGPSAHDFWSGAAVGVAEVDPAASPPASQATPSSTQPDDRPGVRAGDGRTESNHE